MEQGSKEWHEYRSTRLGSSDAPVIMGVNPYKNIYDLYLEKTKEKEPTPVNKFVTDKGHTYEDLALLDLEKETELIWRPEVFVSEENDSLISSVDGHAVTPEPENFNLFWECKYVGKEKYNNFVNDLLPLRERVSEQYYPQVIHHALITGGERFYFTVVVDDKVFPSLGKGVLKFVHVKFKLKEEDKAYMTEVYKPRLLEFLGSLKTGVPPMGIGATVDFIDIEDSELERLVGEYREEDSKLKPIKDKLEGLKKTIFELSLSYNEKVTVAGNKISVSTGKPKQFIDYELLVKENPQILQGINIDNYKRSSNVRTTKRITLKKE